MDSHAIRCFQRVFEKKSIHQAAKDLCMTPQGVSRVISALEGEMQTALFIRSRKGMEATPEGRYFASGKADIVYMARQLLADPETPQKIMEGRDADIVHCLRCFTCMAERAATATRRCTVNPLIGRKLDGTEIQPAPVKKKVLVAGAGPGGLYAAYTAARRGHHVILCEKESEVGGILKSEQAIPFKREMYELGKTYERLARQAGVEIRLNTEVTPAYAAKEKPQALIIATGSRPLVPPIKGLDGDNVIIVNQYYKEKAKVGNRVIVFGGGLAGCECAIHLGQEGKEVELIEMRPALAPDANVRHRPCSWLKSKSTSTSIRSIRASKSRQKASSARTRRASASSSLAIRSSVP